MTSKDLTIRALAVHLGTTTRELRRFLVARGFLEDHGKGKRLDRWQPTAWAKERWPRIVARKGRGQWLWFAPYISACWRNDGRAVSTSKRPAISDAEAALIDDRLRFKALAHGRREPGFDVDGFTAWAVSKPAEWRKHAVERRTEGLDRLRMSELASAATA